jgi:hypothetical protein
VVVVGVLVMVVVVGVVVVGVLVMVVVVGVVVVGVGVGVVGGGVRCVCAFAEGLVRFFCAVVPGMHVWTCV